MSNISGPVVSVETQVAAPPDKVWSAMTQARSPLFMGATMDTDWREGSRYTLSGEWNGKPFTDYGEIETAAPGRELTFTNWSKTPEPPDSYNAVGITLAPSDGGTTVRLAQYPRGVPQLLDEAAKAEFRKNWSMMLEQLKKAAEG